MAITTLPPPPAPTSTVIRRHRPEPLTIITSPRTFASLLSFLDSQDFFALFATSTQARALFNVPEIKDVILARFVPSYSQCLSSRDWMHYKDVNITLQDLNLFRKLQLATLGHMHPPDKFHT